MPNIDKLKELNTIRWERAKLTRGPEFIPVAKRLHSQKTRYESVSNLTGVPWFVIAVIHQRESSGSFAGVLHNGEKIIRTGRKTKLVPAGRGPFATWEVAAVDALTNCAPYASRWKDWSAGGTLTLLEQYNGLGYFNKGLPSPYVWSGTDQYQSGKYVSDGVFDPNAVDKQLGCAGLIMALMQLDKSIRFPASVIPPPPDIEPTEPVPQPASGGLFVALIRAIAALFKGIAK